MCSGKQYFSAVALLAFVFLQNLFAPMALKANGALQKHYTVIHEITTEGNKVTRRHIILRELTFRSGDTVDIDAVDALVQRSAENLLNTSLFIFVNIEKKFSSDSLHLDLHIALKERWYIWPVPVFELVDRNFNEWWLTRDFSRTNYGFYISHYNFRGRNETVDIGLRLGYTRNISLYYNVPFLNQKQKAGMSVSAGYAQNHEVAYATQGNKLMFYKDPLRFLKQEYAAGIRFYVRDGLYKTHTFFIDYRDGSIADTVAVLNSDYYLHGLTVQKFFRVSYLYKQDLRDNKNYPLKGYYVDVELNKTGLGLFDKEPSMFLIAGTLKKFWEINPRLHTAIRLRGRLSDDFPHPYFLSRALGYGNDFIRGYEYYVTDGQHFLLQKLSFKYTLLSPRVMKVNFLPMEKFNTIPYAFYLNIFYDAGYVWDNQYNQGNFLANAFQYGTGVGVDYVSYYDIVFRLEYSINKFAEKGFFIHLTAPL